MVRVIVTEKHGHKSVCLSGESEKLEIKRKYKELRKEFRSKVEQIYKFVGTYVDFYRFIMTPLDVAETRYEDYYEGGKSYEYYTSFEIKTKLGKTIDVRIRVAENIEIYYNNGYNYRVYSRDKHYQGARVCYVINESRFTFLPFIEFTCYDSGLYKECLDIAKNVDSSFRHIVGETVIMKCHGFKPEGDYEIW